MNKHAFLIIAHKNDLTFNTAEPKVNKAPVHENKEIAI